MQIAIRCTCVRSFSLLSYVLIEAIIIMELHGLDNFMIWNTTMAKRNGVFQASKCIAMTQPCKKHAKSACCQCPTA